MNRKQSRRSMARRFSALGAVAMTATWLAGGASGIAAEQAAKADVRPAKIFADNMMIQRDQPVRVWGWAAPGEALNVALAGKSATTRADANGAWSVELPAMKDGENLELTVTGKNELVVKTVAVSSPVVPVPVAVRRAFAMNPYGASLHNREGLPASPFRTDNG